MKRIYYVLLACSLCINAFSQVFTFGLDDDQEGPKFATGKQLLGHMHKKHKGAYCHYYTFSQKNTHYRNDSVVGHSEWYEAIGFPDKFRIDFGDKAAGNFVIFRNDSSYSYRAHKLVKSKYDDNALLLLLGGMYYRSEDEVLRRLAQAHYNTDSISEQTWNNVPVYVIGAGKGDMSSNQFWVDKKTMRVLRIIEKMNDTDMMDIRFEAYQKLCGGYTETRVSFRRNGKLEQVEEYYDIKPADTLPAEVFSPE